MDERQDLVVDARVMNEGDGWAGSGANPWHVDNATRSVLFLTDESDQPAHIGFSVTAGGVHYYLSSLELAPHETRAIDLRQLRDAQVADCKGNRISAGATDGSVNWIRLDNVAVSGRLVVISHSGGVASSYDCDTCNCPASLQLLNVTPDAVTGIPGDTAQLQATAWYYDCNYIPYTSDVTNSCQWSSGNTAVATVGSTGLATAVGGGSTSLNGLFSGYHYYLSSYYPVQCSSYLVQASDSSSCDVQAPAILKAVSSQAFSYCSGTSCLLEITYQVLDGSGAPINIAGLQIAESVNGTHTGDCTGSLADNETWNTDSTGTMTGPDNWWWCCDAGCNATYTFNQSFTVNGYSVQVVNGSYTGSHNVVTIQCNNGQGSCPSVVPTP